MLKFDHDDDDGTFDRILREAEIAANGDESLKLSLLTRKIVKDFVDKQMQASSAALLLTTSEEEAEAVSTENVEAFDNPGFRIPKRISGTVAKNLSVKPAAMPPLPQRIVNKKKISPNRCFGQTQNSDNEEEAIREPKKQKKEEKGNVDHQEHVPDMPECFKNRIQEENGTDVVLVMQKHITSSDLRKDLNRLSIPRNKIRVDDFIDENEKKMAKKEKGIPSLKENVTLDFKWWSMNNTFTYNLKEKWHSCVVMDADNGLEIGSIVQLWRFRKNVKDLCFALVKVQ